MNKKYLYISLGIAIVAIGGAFLFSQNNPSSLVLSEYVSADTSGLSEASATQTVELKNGDTYDLTASYVKKNINGKEYRIQKWH